MKKILVIAFLTLVNFLWLTAEERYGKRLDRNGGQQTDSSSVGEATGERYRFIDDAGTSVSVPESGARTRTYVYAGMTPVAVTENDFTMLPNGNIRDNASGLKDRAAIVITRSPNDNGNRGREQEKNTPLPANNIVMAKMPELI